MGLLPLLAQSWRCIKGIEYQFKAEVNGRSTSRSLPPVDLREEVASLLDALIVGDVAGLPAQDHASRRWSGWGDTIRE